MYSSSNPLSYSYPRTCRYGKVRDIIWTVIYHVSISWNIFLFFVVWYCRNPRYGQTIAAKLLLQKKEYLWKATLPDRHFCYYSHDHDIQKNTIIGISQKKKMISTVLYSQTMDNFEYHTTLLLLLFFHVYWRETHILMEL